jgi:hypothetical protein
VPCDQIAQRVVRHLDDRRIGQGVKRRGGLRQHQRVEPDHVAGQVEADDLPAAVLQLGEAPDQPLDHQAAMLDLLAHAHDVAVRGNSLRVAGQREHRGAFRLAEPRARLEPCEERCQRLAPRSDFHQLLPAPIKIRLSQTKLCSFSAG